MPPDATQAEAPPRGSVQHLPPTRDRYGFLAAFERNFERHARDGAAVAAAVEIYAGLGLASAARRVLQRAEIDASRSQSLEAIIPQADRRISWSRFDGQFQQNLADFEARTGLGEAIEQEWHRSRSALALLACNDGELQLWDRRTGAWIPGLFGFRGACSIEALRDEWAHKVIRPLAVHGIGLGDLALRVVEASRDTYVGFSAPVVLIEQSLLAWAVALHLHDWRTALGDDRVTICAGPDALNRLDGVLACVDRAPPVLLTSGPLWAGSVPAEAIARRLEACSDARSRQLRTLHAEVTRARLPRTGDWWAQRFEAAGGGAPPLRVLGVTSRYTTVLQYSMRDLMSAFERLGHQAEVFIEADASSHFAPIRLLERIREIDPDLIITIDHLQAEFTDTFPENIPAVCWIQDRLATLFTAEAGRSVRPLEFVIGHGFPECLTEFGYPPDRFFPCIIPTNPAALLDPRETAEDLEPYRCDVMFATNASTTPAELHARYRRKFEGDGERFVDAAYESLLSVARAPRFCGDYDYAGLVGRVEYETGIRIADAAVRGDVVSHLRSVADQQLREQAIRTAAAWADERGGRFHLYGRGWEQRADFARFARGVLQHGVPLGRAFRAAKISLHAGCNSALHQRVLDGLCAGGFFLMRHKPSDRAHEMNQAIYRHVRDRGLEPPFLLRPQDLPEPAAATLRAFLEVRGTDPRVGVEMTREALLNVLAECEWGTRASPAGVWPRFAEVLYTSAAEMIDRIEHFLRADDERKALAAEMRAAVVGRYTYDALVVRLLKFIRQALGGRRAAQ